MKTFKAKEYLNRNDLEKAIKSDIGINTEKNEMNGHLVEGTRAELKKLFLTDESSLWGIKCKITDTPTTKIINDKYKSKLKKDEIRDVKDPK